MKKKYEEHTITGFLLCGSTWWAITDTGGKIKAQPFHKVGLTFKVELFQCKDNTWTYNEDVARNSYQTSWFGGRW